MIKTNKDEHSFIYRIYLECDPFSTIVVWIYFLIIKMNYYHTFLLWFREETHKKYNPIVHMPSMFRFLDQVCLDFIKGLYLRITMQFPPNIHV